MRAAIRAKVTAARLERAADADRPSIARAARAYFEFAARAIAPPGSAFVAVGGLSGTGKSVLARMLAPAVEPMPGAVIMRSDVERKALFALSEAEKLPSSAYTDEVNARVYATLGDKARRVVAAGHSVIVDAVFAKPEERARYSRRGEIRPLAAAGPVPHGRHGHEAGPRRRPRPRCLRCRYSRGAGAGALRTGPPGLGQDRCLRDAGSHAWPAPRQPCVVLD